MEDNSFYCPECGTLHSGSNLDEISRDVSSIIMNETNEVSITGSTSLSNDFEEGNSRGINTNNGWTGYSSNSASETESELSEAYTKKLRNRSSTSSVSRTPCIEPNCKYKAIANKYCLKHSQKLRRFLAFIFLFIISKLHIAFRSIVEVEMIAKDMMTNHDLRYFSVGRAGKKIMQMDHTDKSLSSSTTPLILLSKFKLQLRIELGEALDIILRAKAIFSRGN